jgi:hypothetical protein
MKFGHPGLTDIKLNCTINFMFRWVLRLNPNCLTEVIAISAIQLVGYRVSIIP